jgi:polysaccharide deacetylase family protein (PEP-CTERM system associated)
VLNALTIDIEDYFQTEAVASVVHRGDWDRFQSRIEHNTWRLLELLDRRQIRATMFFLGWVAERYPQLVKTAAEHGHEVACHSYWHRPVFRLTPDEFREDTRHAKNVIENCIGRSIKGYRAPCFSILSGMNWAHDILTEEGFIYSSSSNPIRHVFCDDPYASRLPYRTRSGLWEFPITTWRVLGTNLPVGGGAYLRILPFRYVSAGLQQVADSGETLMTYLHPWEIDPDQPKIKAGLTSWLRQYTGLRSMESRLEKLIARHSFDTIENAYGNYLNTVPLGLDFRQIVIGGHV